MSGPKIDQAELERRKREEIERARLERLRRIREQTDLFCAEKNEIESLIRNIKSECENVIKNVSNIPELAYPVSKIVEQRDYILEELSKLTHQTIGTEPEEISSQIETMRKTKQFLKERFDKETEKEYKRIEEYLHDQGISKKLVGFSLNAQDIVTDKASLDTISFGSNNPAVEKKSKTNSEMYIAHLHSILQSEYLFSSDRDKVQSLLKDYEERKSMEEKEILDKECAVFLDHIRHKMCSFSELYQEYLAEYVAYREIANSNLPEKTKDKFASLKAIQEEISCLQEAAKLEKEQQYIREQIDEVMRLFGYRTSESLVFDSRQKGQHFICEEEDGDSAIHIHISESNQIMMETVDVEDQYSDAPPYINAQLNGYQSLDPGEVKKLLEKQGKFCDMHPKMVEELRKRGVRLQKKNYNKPSIDNCKKIVRQTKNYKRTASMESAIQRKQQEKGKQPNMLEMK